MSRSNIGILISIIFIYKVGVAQDSAGLLNNLFAPGPLIYGHADLERTQCIKCHDKNRVVTDSKCLVCHKEIHQQVKRKQGFHGGQTQRCAQCHKDHKGRDFDTVSVDKNNFDHSRTGFGLNAKHQNIQCDKCHMQKRTKRKLRPEDIRYFGATVSCNGCHKKDDVHDFSGRFATKSCGDCHNMNDWQGAKFNHERDAGYSLLGKHQTLSCQNCHGSSFGGRFIQGEERKSRYVWPLNEKGCRACHVDYHKKDNNRQNENQACGDCHTPNSWKPVKTGATLFDHNNTRFPLTGKHLALNCSQCHESSGKKVYKFSADKKNFCVDCHGNEHEDQFSAKLASLACDKCHNTEDFSQVKPFDHDISQFPLKGQHREIKCGECHSLSAKTFAANPKKNKRIFRFPNVETNKCAACHKDVHRGQLGKKCDSCHNEKKWQRVTFNHDEQSQFALRGKHRDIACSQCHKRYRTKELKPQVFVKYKSLAKECNGCHKDPHKNRFGNSCGSCHTERSWQITREFHKNFALGGVHYMLACEECHIGDRQLSGMSNNCYLCHQADDIHRGTLPNCGDCHSQHFWEVVNFRHSMTDFPLRGAHRALNCFECHTNGVYQGKSSECYSCHQNQPVSHSSHSSNNCGECHSQYTFTL